eukprot:TRINITY_DN7523_c0_g1_i1.p1 TRINITY_DN7523_c0_g1~~TRINITY_DN7523_c0_g1_i1.p1  ORF type:complete len:388 (-),score=99.03 TRINITY_DN7523_c0_g1_i1:50-1213(-)
MAEENKSLVVKQTDIQQPMLINSPLPHLKPEQVLIRVEKFGFSTNNITYAALGNHPHFRYFEFFPIPADTEKKLSESHGNVPVWGFGTIFQSTHPSLKVGERIYGYYPIAKYVWLPVSPNHIVPDCFFASRDHLPKDRKPYNQYYRCQNDSMYVKEKEDYIMLYRPLFWTSFWCDDWLDLNKYFGGKTVVISSASSKTSFCLGYLLQKSNAINKSSLRVVGLTSPSNVSFSKSLGIYDEIYTYDDLKKIDVNNGPFVYIDVTGNPKLYASLIDHLGQTRICKAVSLGMTQPNAATEGLGFRGMEMFFTPEWMKKRREISSVSDITKKMTRAWSWLMTDCNKWVKMRQVVGEEEVEKEYIEVAKGKMDPNTGLVFSMWQSSVFPSAKL